MGFEIDIDGFNREIKKTIEELTAKAKREAELALRATQDQWETTVLTGTVLPGMTKGVSDQRYADTIRDAQINVTQDSVSLEIKDDDAQERIQELEQGFPPFDMKPGLLSGPAAKFSKKGTRYVDVPIEGNKSQRRFAVRVRRLSDRTAAGKWIHPGVAPNPVTEVMEDNAHQTALKAIGQMADKQK